MKTYRYMPPDLNNRRDNRVVLHVFRNFMTTQEAVHRLFFNGLKPDASRQVLTRLTDDKLLTQYPLYSNKAYYRLGPRAIYRWGYPRSRGDVLGWLRLPYEVGCLHYTCLGGTPKKRLLQHRLLEKLPWFPHSLMQWAYLWENDRLGMIRVEPRCRAERVLKKLGEQIYGYAQYPEFSQLIEDGRFFVVIVTATEPQALAVEQEQYDQQFPAKIVTSYYPELERFI